MNNSRFVTLAQVLLLTVSALSCGAARAEDAAATPSNCQLRVATGKRGNVFSKLLRDMRSMCSTQVQLCEVESDGGLRNTVLLAANEADLGFAQIDTLQDMKQSDENIAALQAVLPMNVNLLHILALRTGYTVASERSLSTLFMRDEKTILISRASDLKGLPVALVGSAQILARTLDRAYGLELRFVDVDSDEQAIAALRTKQVAAVLLMSGWPSSLVDNLTRDSQLVLAAFDLPVRPPYVLLHKNYPKLGAFKWPFLAAPNLLVARPFNPDGVRGGYVMALQRCILSHLEGLREGAFEPGWKEIKNPDDLYGWPGFARAAKP